MKQIKIFTGLPNKFLEKSVNDWIKENNINVYDIEVSTSTENSPYSKTVIVVTYMSD